MLLLNAVKIQFPFQRFNFLSNMFQSKISLQTMIQTAFESQTNTQDLLRKIIKLKIL